MKKLFFILLACIPLVCFANDDDEIELHEMECNGNSNRNETAVTFSAGLELGNTIKVLSSEVTTFNVKIHDASTGLVVYQGTTTNGTLHIAGRSFSAGQYRLIIEAAGTILSGVFEI